MKTKLDPPLWMILAVMVGSGLFAIVCVVAFSLLVFP